MCGCWELNRQILGQILQVLKYKTAKWLYYSDIQTDFGCLFSQLQAKLVLNRIGSCFCSANRFYDRLIKTLFFQTLLLMIVMMAI